MSTTHASHYCKYEAKIEGMDGKLDSLIEKVDYAIST